jgi:2,4-dienoyl-CoA reductase-like NADH-dependent reductase (Old Yellow Enzyme family)
MANLFETTTINAMTLENRFVRSATWEGLAGTTVVTPQYRYVRESCKAVSAFITGPLTYKGAGGLAARL